MVRRHPSTPEQRVQLVSHLIAHAGEYGMVTRLSQLHQVSRQTLYTWTAQARQLLEQVWTVASCREVPSLERAILTLLVESHASERGIAVCLAHLGFGTVSLGSIHAIIAEAERRALDWMHKNAPPTARPLALDEIYRSRSRDAYLSMVDSASWAVWACAGPLAVDGDSWTLLLWQAQEAGLRFASFVSDGERAITQACALVAPTIVHQRDVWHVLHRCAQVQARLEALLTRLQQQQATIERQLARLARGERPRGRTPHTDLAAHAGKIAHASRTAEELRYLSGELRSLLEVVVLQAGQVLDSARRQAELLALLELLNQVMLSAPESVREQLRQLYRYLELAQGALLSFTPALDRLHQQAGVKVGADGLALIAWAWQRISILGPTLDELLALLPAEWRASARVLITAWERAVRASSAVENWHSILRPHLAVHRKLSNGRLALLAVWHNHRVFPEGAHAGHSPLQLSGMSDVPTDWLLALGYESPQTPEVPVAANGWSHSLALAA